MKLMARFGLILACVLMALPSNAQLKTENVILITMDGLRVQELFGGLDSRLNKSRDGLVGNPRDLRDRFDAETPEERRAKLMPFFWSVIAEDGLVWGDPDTDVECYLENKRVFSYPGYNEILTGRPDPAIDSNDKKPNENVTVLEWLNQMDAYNGRVEAFCSWDVFPYIINEERSGVPVNAGWEAFTNMTDTHLQETLNSMTRGLPREWGSVRWDSLTFEGAMEALKNRKPRVLYVGLGETDDWAHGGRYDHYIDSAYRSDVFIREIWETAQSMPEYAGKTTLVITTDHGRGDTHPDWKSHGINVEDAEKIWFAVLGPDTKGSGIAQRGTVTQSQTAATVAALLGHDFTAAYPEARPPVPEAIGK